LFFLFKAILPQVPLGLIEVKTKIKSLVVIHCDSKKEEKKFPHNKVLRDFEKNSANNCSFGRILAPYLAIHLATRRCIYQP
jgi:hypothetical protein